MAHNPLYDNFELNDSFGIKPQPKERKSIKKKKQINEELYCNMKQDIESQPEVNAHDLSYVNDEFINYDKPHNDSQHLYEVYDEIRHNNDYDNKVLNRLKVANVNESDDPQLNLKVSVNDVNSNEAKMNEIDAIMNKIDLNWVYDIPKDRKFTKLPPPEYPPPLLSRDNHDSNSNIAPKVPPRHSIQKLLSNNNVRPLPSPPNNVPPPKPPHLPPDFPPPELEMPESAPKIPPRVPIRNSSVAPSLCNDILQCVPKEPPKESPETRSNGYGSIIRNRSDSEATIKSNKSSGSVSIARSQTLKEKNRPSIEKRPKNPSPNILLPMNSNFSDNSSDFTSSGVPIHKSGFLWKTGNDRKEFKDRWCVLQKKFTLNGMDNGQLSYFYDRKSSVSRGRIWLKDVSFIKSDPIINPKVTKLPQSNFYTTDFRYFEIGLTSHRGRIFIFAAKCAADQRLWINTIANTITSHNRSFGNMQNLLPADTIFDQMGYLYVKHGISGQWSNSWVILRGKSLYIKIIDSESGNTDIQESDLRKVMSVSYASVHQVISCSMATESGQPICLTFPHRVLYLQSDLRSHTEAWNKTLLRCWNVPECGAKLEDQYLTNDYIPVAIDKCINFISTYGVEIKNLYLSHHYDTTKVNAIVNAFKANAWDVHLINSDEENQSEGHSPHEVTAALGMFLRSMSECILTEKFYHNWIKANEVENKNERLEKFKLLLNMLPSVNLITLKRMIAHFVYIIEKSDKNRCNLLNLAPVVCPNILFLKVGNKIVDDRVSTFEGGSAGMDILTDLILSYGWLFDVTTEELEKERKIQKALEMLKDANAKNRSLLKAKTGQKSIHDFQDNEFLCGVFIYNRQWGKCLNVRLTPTMTAHDLIEYAVRTASIKDKVEDLSVYECVCDDQLERPLHHSEVVLTVTLLWTQWTHEDAKDNYLCIKRNDLFVSIKPYLITSTQTPITMFSELRFADKSWKSFKKILVEFICAKLSCYKDAKAEKSYGQWNIEDITWYIGAEKKRSAPNNKLTFTFIDRNLPLKRTKDSPYFGRTVCCNTEEEFYKWIACMLSSEYPNGVLPLKPKIDLLS